MPGRPHRVTKTEAVVLGHRRLGDADRIVTLLTPAHGKLDAVVKGALRTRSKLAGHLEPLRHVEVVLAHGRNLDIVTQAQTVEAFTALSADLERLSSAIYLADLADRFTVERQDERAVFDLLHASLVRLARGDGLHLATRTFELELLAICGFRPEWDVCISCRGALLEDETHWTAVGGGAVCARCRAEHPQSTPIDVATLKVLRAIQRGPYEQAARVRLTPQLAAALEQVMHGLVRAIAERDLTSQHFVAAARRVEATATER